MRITCISVYRVRIPFRRAFRHSLQARELTDTLIVSMASDDGVTGYGEILPRQYLTGEVMDRVVSEDAPKFAHRWLGKTFGNKGEVFHTLAEELEFAGRSLATFAGFELALLDLTGQVFDFAAGDILQRPPGRELQSGAVIDFGIRTEDLSKHCRALRLAGRQDIKIKVGLPDDLQRLRIISRVLQDRARLRIDANGAWTATDAVKTLLMMRQFDIKSVEQPVPASDLIGMHIVRESTGLPVVADESLCSLQDAHKLIEAKAADVLNIRLGKCGGFLASLRLIELAERNGLQCQLGTLVGETGILSQAAEIFGSRMGCFEYLEGKGQNRSLLMQDILESHPLSVDINPYNPGLDIKVARDRLLQRAISSLTIFCGAETVS
jgi:L-Ala-D/L-Glu epimerase